MLWYIVKLLVLLPLIGLLAWGCLKFAQKMQARVAGGRVGQVGLTHLGPEQGFESTAEAFGFFGHHSVVPQ